GMRYSALNQINLRNVTNLQQVWIYHSGDGSNNLQCNPIVVRDVMIAPTPGKFMVGIKADTGIELWRFKPEGRPAFRGLIYWPGKGSEEKMGNEKWEKKNRVAGPESAHLDTATTNGPLSPALSPSEGKRKQDYGQPG